MPWQHVQVVSPQALTFWAHTRVRWAITSGSNSLHACIPLGRLWEGRDKALGTQLAVPTHLLRLLYSTRVR